MVSKRAWLLAAAPALLLAGSAFAQDEGGTHNWTAVYLGMNLGGAFSTSCYSPTRQAPPPNNTTVYVGTRCPNSGSFIGGGQFGFNYQTHGIVLGIEGDVGGGTFTFNGNTTPSSIETIRGRLGYPVGNALIYLTGGGAFSGGH